MQKQGYFSLYAISVHKRFNKNVQGMLVSGITPYVAYVVALNSLFITE